MREILVALLRSFTEACDSKKAIAAFVSALTAVLVLLAGQQHWTWLDPETSHWIAGLVVAKASVYVAAQAHVDAKVAESQPVPPLVLTATTGTTSVAT